MLQTVNSGVRWEETFFAVVGIIKRVIKIPCYSVILPPVCQYRVQQRAKVVQQLSTVNICIAKHRKYIFRAPFIILCKQTSKRKKKQKNKKNQNQFGHIGNKKPHKQTKKKFCKQCHCGAFCSTAR